MEVSPGFKRTDIGAMPEDWEPITTADVVDPQTPICYGVVQVGEDTNGGVPIVAIKYVKEILSAPLHRAALGIEQPYARSRVKGGDVLISIKGTIGRVGVVPAGFEGNISRELARLRLKEGYVPDYIAQQLESQATQARMSRAVVGTTRLEFSIATLRKFEIPVPCSLAEQRTIAGALTSVDALLGGLDRLIAKKRDLKQTAMQQLLTGQTRLPGFSGEWEVRRLADVAEFCAGAYLAQADYRAGEYEVQGAGSVMGYHDVPNFSKAISVVGRVGTVGRPRFIPNGCWVNSNAAAVVAREPSGTPEFVHLLLLMADWSKATSVTAQPFLVVPALLGMEFSVPEPAEQRAISAVLSDMDADLAALEARRDKTHDLKRAMMHELLTGKTRLVPADVAHA